MVDDLAWGALVVVFFGSNRGDSKFRMKAVNGLTHLIHDYLR